MIFLNWIRNSLMMLLCGLLTNCFSMNQGMMGEPNDKHKAIYGTLNAVGKKLSKKHRMIEIGKGVGAMDKLWLVCLSFERCDFSLTEEDARRLIVSCIKEVIETVNHDQKLRPFLKVYPFTADNIDISIYNYARERGYPFHPSIATVSGFEGKIAYRTRKKENPIQFESEKYETFAEAVAILEKEKATQSSSEGVNK